MFIIGITGGTGAGKTTALRALGALGALALDADAVYHELLAGNAELNAELAARFPGAQSGGAVDRKLLAGIVWNDQTALLELNSIAHKYVGAEIDRRLSDWEAQGGAVAAIDAIALIESGIAGKCDIVVGVDAPVEARIKRIMRRDGIPREQAEMRVNAQKPAEFFREHCDYMLEGISSTSEEFEERCREFFIGVIPR